MTTKKKVTKKKTSTAKKSIAVGVGLAAAGLAAYLLTGPGSKKRRASLKKWTVSMEKDIAREVKKLQKVSKKEYDAIVAKVARTYSHLDKKDIQRLVVEAKKHFKAAERSVKPMMKRAVTKATKIVRTGSSRSKKTR